MGKDKKKDADKAAAKKAAKQEKQAAKSKKSATKAARKSGALDSDEEDIEVLIAKMAEQDTKRTAITIETLAAPPSPRVNFSLVAVPGGGAGSGPGSQELIMFGGEYFDGAVNSCYNDLYRVSIDTKAAFAGGGNGSGFVYRSVVCPNTPGARCSHQAVLIDNNKQMFLFGGEFATANQFHHWGDSWKLDLASNRWSLVDSKKNPSSRSGHRMGVWRSSVVLFGGFYQTMTRDAWYGDTWIYDTKAGGSGWTEVSFPVTASTPAARSGMQFVAVPSSDLMVLHGGYSEVRVGADRDSVVPVPGQGGAKKGNKPVAASAANFLLRKTRSVVHTDTWILRLSPLLTGGQPTWERVRTTGVPPSPRVGFTMVPVKDKLLLFGGVQDKDEDAKQEVVRSTFYSELYSYDIGRRRWYKLDLRSPGSGSGAGAGGGAAARRARRKAANAAKGGSGGGAGDDDVTLSDDEAGDANNENGSDYEGGSDEEAAEALQAAGRGRGSGGRGGKGGKSSGSKGKGSNNSGKGSSSNTLEDLNDLDDAAFYVYIDGKLVQVEDDDEEEEGAAEGTAEGGEAGAAVEGSGSAGDVAKPAAEAPAAVAPASTAKAAATPSASAAAAAIKPATGPAPTPTPGTPTAPAAPAAPAPVGRIRAGMWADGHFLYIYGGLHETGAGGSIEASLASSMAGLGLGGNTSGSGNSSAAAGAGGSGSGPNATAGTGPSAGRILPDVEVTLDDCWRLDLRTRASWECLDHGRWRSQAWKAEDEEDDDDEDEEDGSDGDEDEDEDSDDEGEGGSGSDADETGGRDRNGDGPAGASAAAGGAGGGAAARHSRSQMRGTKEAVRARQLRDKLGLEDPATTPQPGEKLATFFARTAEAWVAQLLATPGALPPNQRLSGKDIRRKAFALARPRYEAVWPMLQELHEVEQAQKELEEEAAAAAAKARAKARGGKGSGR